MQNHIQSGIKEHKWVNIELSHSVLVFENLKFVPISFPKVFHDPEYKCIFPSVFLDKKAIKFWKSIWTSWNVNFNIPNFSLHNMEAVSKVGSITTFMFKCQTISSMIQELISAYQLISITFMFKCQTISSMNQELISAYQHINSSA